MKAPVAAILTLTTIGVLIAGYGGANADPAQALTTLIGAVTTLRADVQQSMSGIDCP